MDSTSRLLCDIFSVTIECEKVFICLYQTVLHHYFCAFDPIFHSRVLWGKKECIIISSVSISTYFSQMNRDKRDITVLENSIDHICT